tara:strand:+ start:3166 stop:3885 length:720 start_codon:yes stop_codon:yes gene_type:complete
MKQLDVVGMKIYPFKNSNELLNVISSKTGILVALNFLKICNGDKKIIEICNNHYAYADGIIAVKAIKKYNQNVSKIAGCELWIEIIEKFLHEKSFYFIGGTNHVINKTVEKLQNDYKEINISGYRNGYLKTNDEEELIEDLLLKKPDIVFVAMGSPKQEYLMEKLYNNHKALYQGLGGSFDLYINKTRRAPKIFLNTGLEGFYRFLIQPSRIIGLFKLFKKRNFYLLILFFLKRKKVGR